jgi:hypothetical protein
MNKPSLLLTAMISASLFSSDAQALCGKAEALKIAAGLERTFKVVKRRDSRGKISVYFERELVPTVAKHHLDKITTCILRLSSSNPTRMQIIYKP